MKTIVGIDNGTSGSIGVISKDGAKMFLPPTKTEQNYTKKKDSITRIDVSELISVLSDIKPDLAVLERPFVNPGMFKATGRALRALEATLITLEVLSIPFVYCDSKEWQKMLLPKGVKGTPELKKASMDIGVRLFPTLEEQIKKQKDADGLLIAEWARRKSL